MLVGHRLPRFSNGLFWLLASLGLALSLLARTNYLLAFLAALLLFYALLWLQDRLPRLTMALACLLPLPLLWFSSIYFSGSFDFRPRVALLGALLGAVAGALWPRAMLALLAPFMGISLLAWASPFTLSFPRLAVPGLACLRTPVFRPVSPAPARAVRLAPPRRSAGEILTRLAKMGRGRGRAVAAAGFVRSIRIGPRRASTAGAWRS